MILAQGLSHLRSLDPVLRLWNGERNRSIHYKSCVVRGIRVKTGTRAKSAPQARQRRRGAHHIGFANLSRRSPADAGEGGSEATLHECRPGSFAWFPLVPGILGAADGENGQIEEISLTYVVVRAWDQRRLILAITYFIDKPFQNWTRSSSELLGTVFLYVDYMIPTDELRAEAKRLLDGTRHLVSERENLLRCRRRRPRKRGSAPRVASPSATNHFPL
jgi:Mechanosensitive ion channel